MGCGHGCEGRPNIAWLCTRGKPVITPQTNRRCLPRRCAGTAASPKSFIGSSSRYALAASANFSNATPAKVVRAWRRSQRVRRRLRTQEKTRRVGIRRGLRNQTTKNRNMAEQTRGRKPGIARATDIAGRLRLCPPVCRISIGRSAVAHPMDRPHAPYGRVGLHPAHCLPFAGARIGQDAGARGDGATCPDSGRGVRRRQHIYFARSRPRLGRRRCCSTRSTPCSDRRRRITRRVRGLLNAGHRRGAVAGRCVVRGKNV